MRIHLYVFRAFKYFHSWHNDLARLQASFIFQQHQQQVSLSHVMHACAGQPYLNHRLRHAANVSCGLITSHKVRFALVSPAKILGAIDIPLPNIPRASAQYGLLPGYLMKAGLDEWGPLRCLH